MSVWGRGKQGGKCLLPQNTEPRGEPLMAERDMSTFRIGWGCGGSVTGDTLARRPSLGSDLSGSDPFRYLPTDGLRQDHDSRELICASGPFVLVSES